MSILICTTYFNKVFFRQSKIYYRIVRASKEQYLFFFYSRRQRTPIIKYILIENRLVFISLSEEGAIKSLNI